MLMKYRRVGKLCNLCVNSTDGLCQDVPQRMIAMDYQCVIIALHGDLIMNEQSKKSMPNSLVADSKSSTLSDFLLAQSGQAWRL